MSVRCSKAVNDDRDRLVSIWSLSFSEDTALDAAAFLDRFGSCGYVLRVDDHIATMLFLIPATVENGDSCFPVGYIYAGATHPDHRGKGLYRRLLQYVAEEAKKDGLKALFLRPADEKLEESYRRMGFVVPMTCREVGSSSLSMTAAVQMKVLDAQTYCRERSRYLREIGVSFVNWSETVLEHILTWCEAVRCNDAIGLSDHAHNMFWEWLGDESPCGGACARTVGAERVVGLLRPLEQECFTAMSPIYMGYGME